MMGRSCSSATLDSYCLTVRFREFQEKNTFQHLDVKKIKKQMNLGAHVHSHLWKGAEH